MKRAIIVVIDSMGIGAMPDHAEFNDIAECNTLKNVCHFNKGLKAPNMAKLGLGKIQDFEGIENVPNPIGQYGTMQEKSKGKDTTTGHWEIAGLVSEKPFSTFPNGFPKELIDKFIEESNGKLQGEGWDLVRDKMDEYSEMLQEKNDYAMEFVDKTIESYKKLIEYFEDNVVLDTSTIPEVKTSIDNLTTQIEMLIAHIAELSDQWEEVTVYGDDGKPAGTMLQKVDNSALIAECNEQLDECRQVKQEMEAVLEKLEGLKGFDKALADTFTFLGLASISANSFLGGML